MKRFEITYCEIKEEFEKIPCTLQLSVIKKFLVNRQIEQLQKLKVGESERIGRRYFKRI